MIIDQRSWSVIQKYLEELSDIRQQGKVKYNLAEVVVMTIKDWCNLNAIGMAGNTRIINGVETVDIRYFISSVTDIKLFEKAVRQHRRIENSLHRYLDIATNLYKFFTSVKLSLKANRFKYSFDVIFNKFFNLLMRLP